MLSEYSNFYQTLMNFILLILKNIFCAVQFDTMQCNFFIVTDRKMKGLVKKDGTKTDLILPVDESNGFNFDYMWDKYFPKPIMYGFNCKKIMNSKKSVNLKLKGITDNDEVLFGFTLNYTNQIFKFLNFVDSNDTPINDALYANDKNYNNIFVLSSKSKFVRNLRSSLNYLLYMNKLTPLCEEVLKNFFRYIKNINDLAQSVKEDKTFNSASAVKDYMVLRTIGVLKSYSSIKVPSVKSLCKFSSTELFGIDMNILFWYLEDVVEVNLKNKKKGSKKECILNITDISDYIKNVIIQDDSLTKCVSAYKDLYRGLKRAERSVYELRKVGITYTAFDIISDCDVKKIDEFLKTYASILLDYYKIIKSINYDDVFNHCFICSPSEFDSLIKKVENFFVDKLIANRICSFIRDYEKDKTNFLIFSQTEIFKHTLSSRILSNLKIAKSIYLNQNTLTTSRVDKTSTKLNDIIYLQKLWVSILKDDFTNKVKSFNDLLIQEKLPLPTYNTRIVSKPQFIEDKKQENKPSNLSKSNLSEVENEPNNQSENDLGEIENELSSVSDSDLSGTERELDKFKSVKRRLNTVKNKHKDQRFTVPECIKPEYSIEKGFAYIILSLSLFFTLIIGFKGLIL